MRGFFRKKLWILLSATLALGALTILALSLDNVPFQPARQYGHEQPAELPAVSFQKVVVAWNSVPFWKQVVLWSAIGLIVFLIGLLLSPDLRKRFFQLIIRTAATVLAVWFLIRNYGDVLLGFQNQRYPNGLPPENANNLPVPTFNPPQISPLFSYLVSFAFALLWIAVMWGLYQGWKRYVALNTKKPLEELAHIARTSLDDLRAGRDSSDVIINCYLRMSDVVADKRHLQREIAMTPQEFAVRLERAGLPGEAVRRLTRLFEMVRYGDRKSAPKDVSEAVNCLNTILHYCGETI